MRYWLAAALVLAVVVVPAWGADIKIVQKDERFSERDVSAKVGDKLTFVNADTVVHNVFSEKRTPFDIRQSPGRSDTVVLDTAGELEIECAIHPRMRLKVRVESKKPW